MRRESEGWDRGFLLCSSDIDIAEHLHTRQTAVTIIDGIWQSHDFFALMPRPHRHTHSPLQMQRERPPISESIIPDGTTTLFLQRGQTEDHPSHKAVYKRVVPQAK